MEKANFFINKVVSMMENGKIIICMGMVNFIIQIINLHIKENGLLINFMVKAKYLMMSLFLFSGILIIQTLIVYNRNGNIMKVI
jgi:hypothetical protein